jgi:hypothetical protein
MPAARLTFLLAISTTALTWVGTNPARGADTPSALERSPEGWTDLLAQAGPALKGWTRLPLPATGKLKSETQSQWSIDPKTGSLVCRGDGGHEWLRWDEPVEDGVFHVEWRFTPVPGKKGYNSGVYTRNSPDAAYYHQAQTGDASGGYLFGNTPVNGSPKRFNLQAKSGPTRVKPAGEWNTFELTSRGKIVTLWVNGAVTSTLDPCEVPRGHVGLEAEGWRIEFRNVRLKKLAP